mmetsp:Transcript_14381/g.50008  ORF Transcript_14381/g.50008 Transcript_14381/m.50008 type:complete len:272 (-) Transcript_14381:130-945(-)
MALPPNSAIGPSSAWRSTVGSTTPAIMAICPMSTRRCIMIVAKNSSGRRSARRSSRCTAACAAPPDTDAAVRPSTGGSGFRFGLASSMRPMTPVRHARSWMAYSLSVPHRYTCCGSRRMRRGQQPRATLCVVTRMAAISPRMLTLYSGASAGIVTARTVSLCRTNSTPATTRSSRTALGPGSERTSSPVALHWQTVPSMLPLRMQRWRSLTRTALTDAEWPSPRHSCLPPFHTTMLLSSLPLTSRPNASLKARQLTARSWPWPSSSPPPGT